MSNRESATESKNCRVEIPGAIVERFYEPTAREDVGVIVAEAARERTGLLIAGGRTRLHWANLAQDISVGLSLRGLSGVDQFEPEEGVLHAIGIVAYEMLTGRVPFTAESPLAVLIKHVSDSVPIPPPQEVSPTLWRVLERCVAKKPDERWSSATEFVAAMGRVVDQESAGSVSVPAPVLPAGDVVALPRRWPTTCRPGARSPGRGPQRRWCRP